MPEVPLPHLRAARPADDAIVEVDHVDHLQRARSLFARRHPCYAAGVAAPIVLYVKAGCPYCAAKRAELEKRGARFDEVNVSERPDAIPELLKLTKGKRVVPVVVEGARISVAPEGGGRF
jgi:glutaredoxin